MPREVQVSVLGICVSPAVTLLHFFESPDIHAESQSDKQPTKLKKNILYRKTFLRVGDCGPKFKIFAVFREEGKVSLKVSLTKFCVGKVRDFRVIFPSDISE